MAAVVRTRVRPPAKITDHSIVPPPTDVTAITSLPSNHTFGWQVAGPGLGRQGYYFGSLKMSSPLKGGPGTGWLPADINKWPTPIIRFPVPL